MVIYTYISFLVLVCTISRVFVFYNISHLIGAQSQQCPLDFPFVFDEGRQCCRYDNDTYGNPIHFFSMTCMNDVQVLCTADRCISNGMKFELLCVQNLNTYVMSYNILAIQLSTNLPTHRMGHNLYSSIWRQLQ